MNGLPYYKAYPRDFIEGTIGMSLELKGAYRVLLDLIYMQGGDLPDDPRYISGLLGCTIRKWKSIREQLLDAGKISVNGEFLSNERAVSELETLAKLQENQAEKARGPRKNKGLEKPQLSQPEPEPDTEDSEPNGSDGEAVDATKEAIWKRGVPYLVECGVPERQARSAIGKFLRDAGAQRLYDALAQSKAAGTGDPIPYLTEVLKPEKNNSELMAEIVAIARARRREEAV